MPELDIKTELVKRKQKYVYDATYAFEVPTMIASKLNISYATLKKWLDYGKDLSNQYANILEEEIEVIDTSDVLGVQYKADIEQQYKEENGMPEEADLRNDYKFMDYLADQKRKANESIVATSEEKSFKKLVLDEDKETNKKICSILLFYRAYERASQDRTAFYLDNCQKHSKTAKNVSISERALKRRLPDDFGEKPQKVEHSHDGTVKIDFIKKALEYEKEYEKMGDSILD